METFVPAQKKGMSMQQRQYNIEQVVTFAKVTGRYGGLSNMSSEYPMFVNEVCIPSVEALYQALKFPLQPQIQFEIVKESNAMRAKVISRNYQEFVRPDWNEIKFEVMEWCLKVKLIQNRETFGSLLRSTKDLPIVEYSTKDNLWGAIPDGEGHLRGVNALGRLLMKVRSEYILNEKEMEYVMAPAITGFLLFGTKVSKVYSSEYYMEEYLL